MTTWIQAKEMGVLAKVFPQDSFNLPLVQTGFEGVQHGSVTLAHY